MDKVEKGRISNILPFGRLLYSYFVHQWFLQVYLNYDVGSGFKTHLSHAKTFGPLSQFLNRNKLVKHIIDPNLNTVEIKYVLFSFF